MFAKMSTKALNTWRLACYPASPVINRIITYPKWRYYATANLYSKDENHGRTTLDSSEIKMFSKQMSEWWDVNGYLKSLHAMNKVRIPLIRDGLIQTSERTLTPLQDKKILDVGCGGGILAEGLARLGANVTGIDASEDLINLAREHSETNPKISNNKPTYYHCTIENHIKTHKEHYDAVVASEVIEHITDKQLFVNSCVAAAKPGGRLFFTTPNKTRISQFLTIFVVENIIKIVKKGTHQYDKFITPNELTFLLERNNCLVESIYGLFYNPLNNSWHFTNSQLLLYALQAVKLKSL